MKQRTLDILFVGLTMALLLALAIAGCRKLHSNPILWL